MMEGTHKSLTTYSLVEILDRTFRIYRHNFLSFVAIVALVLIPVTIIQMTVIEPSTTQAANTWAYQNDVGAIAGTCTLGLVISIIQTILTSSMLAYMASENHLGRKPSVAQAFSAIRGRLVTLGIGLFIFYVLIIAGVMLAGFTLQCLVGFLILGLAFYIAIALNAFMAPVLTLEDVGAFQGLNRAWALAKSRFWTVFGLIVAVGLITLVISFAFSTVLELVAPQPETFMARADTGTQILRVILNTALTIFITPVSFIALTLLYYDTRVRLEGLDIAFDALDTPTPRPSDITSPAVSSGLTGRDLLNVIILIVGVVALVVVLGVTIDALTDVIAPTLSGF